MKHLAQFSIPALLLALLTGIAPAAFAAQSSDVPLASFPGVVRVIDGKTLTIDTSEGNAMEFICTRKTRYYDGAKKIKYGEINIGDHVTVEAKPDLYLRPEALIVHLEHEKKPQPAKPAN